MVVIQPYLLLIQIFVSKECYGTEFEVIFEYTTGL